MAYSVTDSLTFSGTTAGTSIHLNSVANGYASMVAIASNGTISSVTDSASNTYSAVSSQAGTNSTITVFVCLQAVLTNTTTVTVTPGTASSWAASWFTINGGLTKFDVASTIASGTGTAVASNATTTTTWGNEFQLAVGAQSSNRAWTTGTGFTGINSLSNGSLGVFTEWATLASASAASASATLDLSVPWDMITLTFSNKIGDFVDAFNQTTLNIGRWVQFTAGSATMAYASTGASTTFPTTSSSSTDGDIDSTMGYDLTGSSVILHVISKTSGTSNDNNLTLKAANSLTNIYQWQIENGTLFAQYVVASAQTNAFSVAYSATTHAWLRIRESGGTTFWDTSTDGITWTNRFSVANKITLTNLFIDIGAVSFGVDTSAGTYKWASLNIAPVVTVPTPRTLSLMGIGA